MRRRPTFAAQREFFLFRCVCVFNMSGKFAGWGEGFLTAFTLMRSFFQRESSYVCAICQNVQNFWCIQGMGRAFCCCAFSCGLKDSLLQRNLVFCTFFTWVRVFLEALPLLPGEVEGLLDFIAPGVFVCLFLSTPSCVSKRWGSMPSSFLLFRLCCFCPSLSCNCQSAKPKRGYGLFVLSKEWLISFLLGFVFFLAGPKGPIIALA